MSKDLHDKVKILLVIALIFFVVGALGRFAGYGNDRAILGIYTPGAFHRAADTVILFAIGLALYNLCGRYFKKEEPPAAPQGDKPPQT
ncbi:hypothetical protein HS125_16915 [bacterium]|nr:hypothetical protein [bacterium]